MHPTRSSCTVLGKSNEIKHAWQRAKNLDRMLMICDDKLIHKSASSKLENVSKMRRKVSVTVLYLPCG